MNLGSVLRRTPAPVLGTVGALRYRSPGLYGDNRVYGRFIVLGHQRTGSTLVTSSLRRNPGVWCFSEVFNPGPIQFFTPGLSNDSRLLKAYRVRDPVGFLERFIFRGYQPRIRAVGFKLFADHMRLPHMEPLVATLAADEGLRCIHVSRANHLRALLSLKLAKSTATWAAKDGGHAADVRVTIEPDELIAFSAKRRADEAVLRESFPGAPLCEVEYQELTRNLPDVLTKLQHFLGVEPVPIEPPLRKQTTGSLTARIVDHDALRAHFEGTEYAGWFDD